MHIIKKIASVIILLMFFTSTSVIYGKTPSQDGIQTISLDKSIQKMTTLSSEKSKFKHKHKVLSKEEEIAEKASRLIDEGKPNTAIRLLEKALKEAQHKDVLLFHLGAAYFKIKKYDKALICLEKLNPKKHTAPSYIWMGFCYCYVKDFNYRRAEKCFLKAIKKDRKSYFAYIGLGRIYALTGKVIKAIRKFNIAKRLRPDLPEAYLGLADVYYGVKAYDKVINVLRKYLNIDNKNPEIYYRMANAMNKQGLVKDATTTISKAIELSPKNGKYYAALCNILLDHQHDFTARPYIKKALKIAPNNSNIHVANGRYWEIQMKLKKAKSEYMLAIKLNPRNEEAYYRFANLVSGIGNVSVSRRKLNEELYKEVEDIFKAYDYYNMVLALNKSFHDIDKVKIYLAEVNEKLDKIEKRREEVREAYETYRKMMLRRPEGLY